MPTILVRYAEIALKRANKYVFEQQLQQNIRRALDLPERRVKLYKSQLAIQVTESEAAEALERLGRIFGIAWFAPAATCPSTLPEMTRAALALAEQKLPPGATFAIRARRSDKSLPFSSQEIERQIGEAVRQASGATVDLGAPQVSIYVSASFEGAYIYAEKRSGPGGLPVGVSGKVLALLSGGPDSIAASYLLAKRGAEVDFLHFHVFPDRHWVLASKIPTIAARLSAWTLSERLYLASYTPFEMRALELKKPDLRYEVIVFRRLMARLAGALARRLGYQALALGDSLGQVASQTMENLVAVDDAVSIPIFRPLIGMDKVEIIDLVRKIGLFEEAAAPYKDCCSIIAPNPVIRAQLERVRELEEKLGVQQLVEQMVEAVETLEIAGLQRLPQVSPAGRAPSPAKA